MEISNFVQIDEDSRESKYQQIVKSIIHNIAIGNLEMDEKIPSINSFSEELYVSRDTVEKAYNILKERNVISSIRGKGFYIARTKLISKINILFLVNKLSSYKMRIYNSFVNGMGANAQTDLHIYHCDETLFLNLLTKHKSSYDYYVIMPHFKTEKLQHVSMTETVSLALKKIPENKLILLDNALESDENQIITVYQDFENDVYTALKLGIQKLSKYKRVVLVYPRESVYPYPRRIWRGIGKFCGEYQFDFEVLDEIYDDIIMKKDDLFIIIEESDLVNFITQAREQEYVLGEDVGVISYNDTPLKSLFGISVVSTDFDIMGETAAKMILNKERGRFKVPFNFIDRDSI
ncbi:GntR family transcriptional regulator [Algibacter lectus]|uniref:GntR family transcriptional regulator n=1 Tax=Algibacter lectus TaxID=221126 RepID=A0A4R8MJA5_9FLAO|nr:GntR family transcriptional regulator [Algibacter lectus]TDY64076.1 GntR family transcriptional regulator [Algibacter lectus]SFB93798.1 regulatory protein, gntR family [Algibacter lectus]